MWVVLLHLSVTVLIIRKVGLEKCQKFIPRNVMSIKNGMEDCKITIIDRAENVLELRRRQSYWQHRLDTFIPNGLNERFVGIPIL